VTAATPDAEAPPASTRARALAQELRALETRLRQGGGPKRIQKQHDDGKLTARERIALLLDPRSRFQEVGLLVAHDQYEGQAPGVGVVTGFGTVCGREVVVIANDATVKAGSWWPETITKMLRAQEIAMRCRVPIIYLVDSAGVNLPYQGGVFPGQYGASRIFYYNSIMRRYLKVPQIAAVMGPCIAGGAYLPALSDVILMVEGTSFMGLGGPNLVKGATGQTVDSETLGGALTHNAISGVAHYRTPDDRTCIAKIRDLVKQLPHAPSALPITDARPQAAVRHAPGAGVHPGRRGPGRVPGRLRAGDDLRPRAHRRHSRGRDRQRAGHAQGPARRPAQVRRHHLRRLGRQGGVLHRDAHPPRHAHPVRAGRERVHGGLAGGALGDHPRRRPLR
jgi:acetyl-CoA carboxylase carboxyltransferase component